MTGALYKIRSALPKPFINGIWYMSHIPQVLKVHATMYRSMLQIAEGTNICLMPETCPERRDPLEGIAW